MSLKTVFNKMVNEKYDFSKHSLNHENMLWFKSLAEPNKKSPSKTAFSHRKPKNLSKNTVSKSKHLLNKGEFFKSLVILSKVHSFQINQTVNEILVSYHDHLIKGKPLSETQFVKRSKALLQNIKEITINQNELKKKIGINLYKTNFNKFLELRQNQQKSESQIIEEAIQSTFNTIREGTVSKIIVLDQVAETTKNHRNPKKLKNENEGLAESIGFKCSPQTKARLVYLAKEFGLSQNTLAVKSVDWIFEAIKDKADLFDILKRNLDPEIFKKIENG